MCLSEIERAIVLVYLEAVWDSQALRAINDGEP